MRKRELLWYVYQEFKSGKINKVEAISQASEILGSRSKAKAEVTLW